MIREMAIQTFSISFLGFFKETHLHQISLEYASTLYYEWVELGFTLEKRKSRRYPAVKITDPGLAVLVDLLKYATSLLHDIARTAKIIGSDLNANKTEYLPESRRSRSYEKPQSKNKIEEVEDFK